MGFPLIIGFYTPEYECEVAEFVTSLARFGMEHDLVPIESLGSWRKNVGYKPTFILKQLKKHKRPVLFNDVDAIVEGPCGRLRDIEGEYDFAGRFIKQRPLCRPGGTANEPKVSGRCRRERGGKTPKRVLKTITSGTIFFNYTDLAMEFLRAWQRNEKGQYLLGQLVLAETWHHDAPEGLRTLRLPDSYCWHSGVVFSGPSQIKHTRGATRHRGEAGGFTDFERQTDSMRRRSGIRWAP